MGAWGYGLFQSDQDLDIMEEISEEGQKLARDPKFTFWHPENHEEVVATLNAGLFHMLLAKFEALKWNHGMIYLAALTMQLGAEISGTDMETIRETLPHTPMYDEAKAQMEKGMNEYKNEAWDFGSLGLLDTVNSGEAGKQPGSLGGHMLNVTQDWSKMPEPMPKKGAKKKEKTAPEESDPKPKAPTGKDTLVSKGTLKAWLGS